MVKDKTWVFDDVYSDVQLRLLTCLFVVNTPNQNQHYNNDVRELQNNTPSKYVYYY